MLMLTFLLSFSQEKNIINSLNIGPTDETDSLKIFSNFNTFYLPDKIDSFIEAPAYELYLFWDTLNFNPYKTNIEFFNNYYIVDLQYDKFSFPLISNNLSSKFGWRGKRFHSGVDITIKKGDTVYAVMEGKVRFAKYYKGYGNVVVIRHSNGLESIYAHLSKILIKNNEYIDSGTPIGLGGATGKTTGPHLHFEFRFLGIPIDPSFIIDFNNMDLSTTFLIINKDIICPKKKHKLKKPHYSYEYHTIKKGDNLYKIAKQYNTTIYHLQKINNLKPNSILKINQKIRIK